MELKKNNYKILMILIVAAILAAATVPLFTSSATSYAEEDYRVSGGRLTYDFDDGDMSDFRLYTEFGSMPYPMDGSLYFWVLAEQKALLKHRLYSDVEVNVDIMTINKSGKFDSGIYVQAKNPRSGMDEIEAWCVNLERDADSETYKLKLHRFYNAWLGDKVVVSDLKLPMNKVHLRVVVKGGWLYAFVDNRTEPTIKYEIGTEAGMVGLRNYYSPNYFDNLTVIGEGNEYDYSVLNKGIERARAIDIAELTESSGNVLQSALNAATAIIDADATQYEIDEVAVALNKALEGVEYKRAFAELGAAITEAVSIKNDNGKVYTRNSWSSLQEVIEICRGLTAEDDEDLVSYWTNRLEYRISALVPYLTEVR